MPWLDVGKWLKEITCVHYSTATHTKLHGHPDVHVSSRTVCLDCGKAVSPRTRISDDVMHDLLRQAKQLATKD